ncbi:hypothetical protein BH11ARM2_BH11ARM2_18370 [soil metagenome]
MVPSSNEWLAHGGAYFILFGQTGLVAAVSAWLGIQTGKANGAENDGCLLAIANVMLSIFGAGVGYFIASFPIYLLTALAGSLLFSSFGLVWGGRRMRRGR